MTMQPVEIVIMIPIAIMLWAIIGVYIYKWLLKPLVAQNGISDPEEDSTIALPIIFWPFVLIIVSVCSIVYLFWKHIALKILGPKE